MRQFVESLRRLYITDTIRKSKIIELYSIKKITQDEKEYILNG